MNSNIAMPNWLMNCDGHKYPRRCRFKTSQGRVPTDCRQSLAQRSKDLLSNPILRQNVLQFNMNYLLDT
jgi:hypothetical protein